MNFSNPQEHVPEAERNNCVIKERVRAGYHRLPYTRLTRLMIKILVTESAKKLNFFPAKNGVSPYYSPRMILHQRNLDYARHCQYAFGTYVQANDEPLISNTNAPRSLDCIYLRYNDNAQGGHELLHLQTNSLITRRTVTPVPITPAIINQVHALAQQENMPEGLKISNRTGQLFYDSAWIAGVDYDAEAFDDDDNDNEDYINEEHDDNGCYDDEQEDYYDDEVDPDELTETEEFDVVEDDNNDNGPGPETEVDKDDELVAAEPTENDDEEVNPNTDEDDEGPNVTVTRSGRVSKPPAKLTMVQHHLHTQAHRTKEEYSLQTVRVIATTMCRINEMLLNPSDKKAHQFIQTYSLMKSLKKFDQTGRDAAYKEMKQLHERVVFKSIKVEDLTELEKRRAMESLIFLVEKRDSTVKGRTCRANGSTQREYMEREEAGSPTAMTESILITGTIKA